MSKIKYFSKACNKVEGFRCMGKEIMQKPVINGRCRSTHENYHRQMAKLALFYERSPIEQSTSELEE